jgi:hypothetical protein
MASNRDQEIMELERRIEDLKGRMPAHSVKPEMLMELERLEEELEKLKKTE